MTRVFYASTLFGAMTLAAALDSGAFGDRDERRLLIVSDNTNVPEIGDGFERSPAFEPLRDRFDDIVRWNELIAPMHPAKWVPPAAEVPMLARLVNDHLRVDDVRELVLESIAVAPARTIGMLIRDCPVTVYSDGLMSYGPTRAELPLEIGRRTTRLLHLDLVPSLTPLLLRENEVGYEAIPDSAFLKIVAELPEPAVADAVGVPMIVGQYLAPLGILTRQEEAQLHADMLRALVARGSRHVVFKPHPAAGRAHIRPLEETAAQLGVRLTVARDGLPAEAWFAAARPELVVSCFSTALLTAARYFGITTATMGIDLVLDRIVPYENSNRVPLTIVDAAVPRLTADGTLADPPATDPRNLVEAVGYCMQANRLWDLRPAAITYLRTHGSQRYFKKRRLERLGLVAPPAYRSPAVRRAIRVARRTASTVRTAWAARGARPTASAGAAAAPRR